MKNYSVEKFDNGDLKVSFSITTKNNKNKVVFDGLEVFTETATKNAKLDLNHDENYSNFDSGFEFTLTGTEIKTGKVYHNFEMFVTDSKIKDVILSDDFVGFSNNLVPTVDPIPSRNSVPRYYPAGGINLEAFTLLTGDNVPAFEGANKKDLKLECFAIDQIEQFAIKEKFTCWYNIGDLVTYNLNVGIITALATVQTMTGETYAVTIEKLDGDTLVVNVDESSETKESLLKYAGIKDLFFVIQSMKTKKEGFSVQEPAIVEEVKEAEPETEPKVDEIEAALDNIDIKKEEFSNRKLTGQPVYKYVNTVTKTNKQKEQDKIKELARQGFTYNDIQR
jgi:hypothetical protein